jgi:hypothetical protein
MSPDTPAADRDQTCAGQAALGGLQASFKEQNRMLDPLGGAS